MHVEQPLRQLSPADFLRLGTDDVAYIKQVDTPAGKAWAIHAADGSPLAVVASYALAEVTVRRNDMEPVAAH